MGLTDILSLAIAAILVNNYILVQFLGCCSFFGVSKKTDTALGMGMAVIFVMAIASAASWAVQYFILEPLGLVFGKIMCKLTGGKVNPLIGSAGVSAVPMAARVSQVEGQKANPVNFLLMHAMGPNVAGVIGSAVAAGFMLKVFGA